MSNFEDGFLNILSNVINNGSDRNDRTGVGSRFVCGLSLTANLAEGFPMITSRKVSFRIAFEETMMFLRGETDTTILSKKGIKIWDGNTSREFLDGRGLAHLPVGSLGTGYSHQWRNFGGTVGLNDGVDQIVNLINGLKNNPNDRRHIVSAWNPTQLNGTPLPPCHLMHMYTVDTQNNKLNSSFIMRSSDLYLGLPTNFMGYAFINVAIAKLLGLTPGELTYFSQDCHLYNNQLVAAELQAKRIPRELPTIVINKELNTIDDLLSLEFTDVEIVGYHPNLDPLPKVEMAV